jgi:hypothetical protein
MSVSVLSIFGQPYEAVTDHYGEPLDSGDFNPIIDDINDEAEPGCQVVLSEREIERDGLVVTVFDVDFKYPKDSERDLMSGIEEDRVERELTARLRDEGVSFDSPTLDTHRLIGIIESGDVEEY